MSAIHFKNPAQIEEKLQKTSSENLSAIHFVLYGRYVKQNFVKRNIRKFSGLPFKSGERETFIKTVSESLSLKQLKSVAVFFDLDCDAILDAVEISTQILDRVEQLISVAKSTSARSIKSVKSAASSQKSAKHSVGSRSSELKMTPNLKIEIGQLREAALLKEAEIIDLESDIIAMKSSSESAAKDKDVSLKEKLLEKKRQMLRVYEARIENKEAMLEELNTSEDRSVSGENTDIESICEESENDAEKKKSIAEWTCNAARISESDEQVRDLQKSFNNFLSRQTVGNNLTVFDGSSSLKWPVFLSQYEISTKLCGFSDQENVMRLDQSLRGEARQCVELLLCTARDPVVILNILKTKYGQPDVILAEIIKKINGLSRVVSNESLLELCCMVQNIAAITNDAVYNFVDQRNIIAKFVSKLPAHLTTQWGSYLVSNGIGLREENLKNFAVWAESMADITSRTTFHADEVSTCNTSSKYLANTSKPKCCAVCKTTEHSLDRCPVFKSSDTKRRWKIAENVHACYCCLSYHRGSCGNRKPCGVNGCEKFHHQLLHKHAATPKSVNVTACTTDVSCDVLLKMIPVKLRGPRGTIELKAILDEGSTTTLLDASIAKTLGLKGVHKPLCYRGAGDIYQYDNDSETIQMEIAGKNEKSKFFCLKDVRTVNNFKLPNQTCNLGELVIQYPYIQHVDLSVGTDTQPLLLIGQNNAKLIVSRQIIQPCEAAPILSKTALGWTIHGTVSSVHRKNPIETTFVCCDAFEKLHEAIKEYFKLENFGVTVPKEDKRSSKEDKRAIEIATNSIKHNNNRYEIALPWKDDIFTFPNTKPMALQRLRCLEKRLRFDEVKRNAYCQEIQNLIEKGYAIKVTQCELKTAKRLWYLPHFPVTNPNKPGKVRVVFDAAAQVNGKSLNDYILSGPDMLTPLFTVLCNFRMYKIAFTADIREMFNRVEIADEDSYTQCFLWRNSAREKEPTTYRMKAMIFGSTSSPFLAQFVKNYNARKFSQTHKEASEAILNNHYVDDYLHGTDDAKHALDIIKDVIFIHANAGFEIRNFTTNSELVRNSISPELQSGTSTWEVDKTLQEYHRVLGMLWNSKNDSFMFSLNFHKIDKSIISGGMVPSKRQVLKTVMSVFDPLGLLSPFIIKAKILLQDIWRAGIGWDDFITEKMMIKWELWLKELQTISQLKIPRYIPVNSDQMEIHTFNDASENAYASVVYVRVYHKNQYNIYLVAAKARVAPLKTITIPKLELLAAVLGTRLTCEVVKSFNLISAKRYYWTDSRTVLAWINSTSKLTSFVAVRVGEILESTEVNDWLWIPTNLNNADICIRENRLLNFTIEHVWFKGPEFLYDNKDQWPKQYFSPDSEEEIVKPELVNITSTIDSKNKIPLPIIKTYYSWTRLLRTTSWIKRFIDNSKSSVDSRIYGDITPTDLLWSELQWQKRVQQICFPVDLCNIQKQRPNKNGRLKKQIIFLDESGIIRILGRILNAEQIVTEKEPVVLDGKHAYVRLLIMHYHKKHNHQGIETVINELKRKYWIPHVRSIVKNLIHKCWYCKKLKSKALQPEMGVLPKERLLFHQKPFTATGIDFFGPFYVKVGRKIEKRYGVLFTCLTVRAIHVEIAHSLTTDACIMAIRRFIARRGEIKIFWTDNGTNFRGANRELMEAYEEVNEQLLQVEAAARQIEWKFIPPNSPHMGGAWERLIGCFKRTIMTIMNNQHPTDEVLATVFAEAEYIVNSRPLTYVSQDPADDCSITPNDILIGRSGNIRSPGVFSEKDLSLRRQWRVSQALTDLFWKRWLKEYLPTLIGRSKWSTRETNLQVGELVVINDSQLPRGEWPLGIIVKIMPGKDEKVRIAEVKTKSGIYRRPVVKLHRLDSCVDGEVNTGGGMSTPLDESVPHLTRNAVSLL